MKYLIACVLLSCSSLLAQPATTLPARQSKYPPKTARTFYSDPQIAIARQNVEKYPSAKAVAQNVIQSADKWLEWKDEDLRFLLTTPDVPRAFATSVTGCPVCGGKMKEAHGDYGWIIDPKKPFKVECPVDHTVFPSNDYATYYRSGFKTTDSRDGKYVDNGRGWTDPKTGEKFWFVAYCNHWMWHKYLVPGLSDLADAYLLTGDKRYAHKAAVMLRRIAEVYPGMDYAKQSRYGQMMAAQGHDYPGKVVNAIWETSLAQHVGDAYDAVFDAIDADTELQRETGQTGPQIRSFIEANFLEDAIDAVFAGKIRGNFGMHQSALVHLAMARQTGENARWFDGLMNNSSSDRAELGLNFALYNLVYRDGFPSETSPGYNFLWVNKIAAYGDLLQNAGQDVFGIPKTKRLFDAVLNQVNAGEFTPDLGDAGGYTGYLEGRDAATFQTAYERYKDPRYAAWLTKIGASNADGFKTVDSLFKPPLDLPADAKLPPAKSRLFDGFGLGILNDAADKTSLSLYYGLKAGHGHYDRLGFELFANGVPIMPDLGYPDAMNDFVPGIYAWSKNTISHNTVVVDAKRQAENVPGVVHIFADSPFVRVIDVDGNGTYPECWQYRRAVIMVDAGNGQTYFVDVFTVNGGDQHDYSLHGPPGEFQMIGGTWSEPAKGTLAGENVALGQMYDDPKLSAKDYHGGFNGYIGSGFQYLFNVQSRKEGDWVAQWKDAKDPHAMLRIRILNQPNQKVMLADAHVSPAKYPAILKYLIARQQGRDIMSHFVSVIEPFKDEPFIRQASGVKLSSGEGVAIKVERNDGMTDVILYNPSAALSTIKQFNIHTRAVVGLTTFDEHADYRRNFRIYSDRDRPMDSPDRPLLGKVTEIFPLHSSATVAFDSGAVESDLQSLVGRTVFFSNNHHRVAHTIAGVERNPDVPNDFTLTFSDDILVGYAKVNQVGLQSLSTSTALPLAPTYRGTTLADELFGYFRPVDKVADGKIELSQPILPDNPLKAGENVWLLDVGVGDRIEVPLIRY